MGIDIHGLNLLKIAAARGGLGRVATLGRQRLYVSRARIRRLLRTEQAFEYGDYCEELLRSCLGATAVDSFDASDYEQATHVHDMNKPIALGLSYDTVFDGGCLEHIYDVAHALRNVSELCSPGGQILHVLPANNYCGHGFWQFSPELFFSLYSPAHGYVDTRVFLADAKDGAYWYEVREPSDGRRASVTSSSALSVLVSTKRGPSYTHDGVYQSDYVRAWSGPSTASGTGLAERIKASIRQSRWLPLARAARDRWSRVLQPTNRLSSRNPHLRKRRVDDMHRRAGTP